jgi:Flp pilus assembly protein TadD
MLNAETRALIARGLGLLGSSCVALGDSPQGEEVLRLAVQYAGDGSGASDIYSRLGQALLDDARPGESIGPLRRAANLGAPGDRIWPLLARAFVERGRTVAALGAVLEARAAGVDDAVVRDVLSIVEDRLGTALDSWRSLVDEAAS